MAVRYLDEHEERCKFCKGDCEIEGMSGSIICHGFVAKTNADRIRSMTDEELAMVFTDDLCELLCHPPCTCDSECESHMLTWLKEECEL